MAKTIYKFPISIDDDQTIAIEKGAKILSAQLQRDAFGRDSICLWALVDTTAPNVLRKIHIRGTGHPCGPKIDDAEFIDTVQFTKLGLVYHVFAKPE